ncbi:MAG: hypothetical protein HUJ75_07750, partial [Parasporobacterium sp.]|nr:hypothetical protein [Parasporobacterium sp.]
TALDYVNGGKTFALSETVKETLSNIKRLNAADIYDQASEWGKKYSAELLQMMRMWFRDVLVYKSTGDDSRAFFYGCQAVRAMAEKISFEGLNSIIQDLADGEDRLRANVKAEAVFENILLRIRKHG